MKKIDLKGQWKLYMDESKKDEIPADFPDTIILPDTTSHAQKGKKNDTRHTGYLTDTYFFEGYAWFQREFEVTEDMGELTLILERTRKTTVYVDGNVIGNKNSLCTSHKFVLPQLSTGTHALTICVDNTDYMTGGGHLTSPDTQTNWNGITGRIELLDRPSAQINDVMIFPDVDRNGVVIKFKATENGTLTARIEGYAEITADIKEGNGEIFVSSEKALPLWDEYNTNLLTLTLSFGGEEQQFVFGMRKLEADGMKIRVNGNEIFLRGKHDGLLFPLTGYAPTEVEEWKKVFAISKSYGINHYRFHTCCPPDAAFTAADEMGIYMQPELPFWGTVPDEITAEQQFLIDEGFRMLKEFGNHPSFVMMTLGNELWGNKDVMNKILKDYKELDNRHLYSDGSNNFQFWPDTLKYADFFSGVRLSRERLIRGSYAMCDAPQGVIQTEPPKAGYDYDYLIKPETVENTGGTGGKILIQYGTGVKEVEAEGGMGLMPEIPVITHEVGQYYTYPDYREISHYKGSIKAENIAIYQERAEERGLSEYVQDYYRASGALAVDCYKREIESALLTRNMAGFQLLDIQDFSGQGTALVGVLNALMEPKDIVTDKQWRCFCNDTIVTMKSDKMLLPADKENKFAITVVTTNPKIKKGVFVELKVKGSNNYIARGRGPVKCDTAADRGFMQTDEFFEIRTTGIKVPVKYDVQLSIMNTEIENNYTFYSFPDCDVKITEKGIETEGGTVSFAYSEDEAVSMLEKGERVIYIPSAEGKLPGTYCTDFWCYPMFSSISESMGRPLPVGTLGCLIQNEHPVLKDFCSEFFTTPQWYEPVSHCHCEVITGTDIKPIVQMIDNPHRADKLGILYEKETAAGVLFISTIRFAEISGNPEAKWLAKGIAEYLLNK